MDSQETVWTSRSSAKTNFKRRYWYLSKGFGNFSNKKLPTSEKITGFFFKDELQQSFDSRTVFLPKVCLIFSFSVSCVGLFKMTCIIITNEEKKTYRRKKWSEKIMMNSILNMWKENKCQNQMNIEWSFRSLMHIIDTPAQQST